MALSQDYIDKVTELVDKYNYKSDLKPGSYIDAEDTVKNWCVVEVKEISEEKDELSIHFEGWSNRYDEELPYNSNKVDAFRLITVGYTGMSKAAKREQWSYHYGDLETLKRKVEDTIDEEFDNFQGAFDATQFLRGELFIYCDCLLSNCDSSVLSKDDFRDIVDFMHQVFKLIITWLEIFPKKYMKYYEVYK